MCDSHADSVLLIYFIHHIRTGPMHTVTSGQITVTVPSHQFEMQGTKTQAKSWLTVLHKHTINPSQNSHWATARTVVADRFSVLTFF